MRCVNFRSGPDRTLPAAPSNSDCLRVLFHPGGRPAAGAPPAPRKAAGTAARWQRGLRCGDGGRRRGLLRGCCEVPPSVPTRSWGPLSCDRAAVPAEVTMLAPRCAPRRGCGVSRSQMWSTVGSASPAGQVTAGTSIFCLLSPTPRWHRVSSSPQTRGRFFVTPARHKGQADSALCSLQDLAEPCPCCRVLCLTPTVALLKSRGQEEQRKESNWSECLQQGI